MGAIDGGRPGGPPLPTHRAIWATRFPGTEAFRIGPAAARPENYRCVLLRRTDAEEDSARRQPRYSTVEKLFKINWLDGPFVSRLSIIFRVRCRSIRRRGGAAAAAMQPSYVPRSANVTFAIQLRCRRANRDSRSSPSKLAGPRRIRAGSTPSNALTLTTA